MRNIIRRKPRSMSPIDPAHEDRIKAHAAEVQRLMGTADRASDPRRGIPKKIKTPCRCIDRPDLGIFPSPAALAAALDLNVSEIVTSCRKNTLTNGLRFEFVEGGAGTR